MGNQHKIRSGYKMLPLLQSKAFRIGSDQDRVKSPGGCLFAIRIHNATRESPIIDSMGSYFLPHFRVLITFYELENDIIKSKEECDKIRRFAVDKNEENFDKLETELAKLI